MREYVQLDIEGRGMREPSFDEAVERVERRSLTRREVLRMGGGIGAAATLAGCTRWSPPFSGEPRRVRSSSTTAHDARVAIVGAGLAGITAAYRLAQQGVHVRLFEAADRVGGRCWTARGFNQGQTAEHGGEFIDSRHVHLRGLVKELHLKLDDLWEGSIPGSVWPEWIGHRLFDHDEIKSEMGRISKAVIAEARKIGIFGENGKATDAAYYYGTVTRAAVAVDQANMEQWLDHNVPGVSQHVKDFLNETMAGWYGLDMPALSALNWIDFFVIPAPGGDERWHVHGGNDQVPNLAAERLPRGTLAMETALQSMAKRRGGGYELRFSGSSKPVIADFVILATPWTTLREIDLEGAGFGSYRMRAVSTLGMGTDVKLLVQYTKRPQSFKVAGDGGIWSGGMEHTDPNFETWESSVDEPGSAGLITVFAGGTGSTAFASATPHGVAPEPIVDRITGHINDVVPGSKQHYSGKAWLDYWPVDPWVRGSYAAYLPGQMTKYWGYGGIIEDNVHFAGEHTSTYSQGFLNGGVESGQRAAIEVMRRLGVSVPRRIASLPYSRSPDATAR